MKDGSFFGLVLKRRVGESDFNWNIRQIDRNITIVKINLIICVVCFLAAVVIRLVRR